MRPWDASRGTSHAQGHVSGLSYLHSRDVTFAAFCQGPYPESIAYYDFTGWQMPWYSARDSADALLAGRWFAMLICYLRDGRRVYETFGASGRAAEVMAPTYGRQEIWEDSPDRRPQSFANTGEQFRRDGRPTAQWARLAAGRSDHPGTASARA